MKTLKTLLIYLLLVITNSIYSQAPQKAEIGTPESILQLFQQNQQKSTSSKTQLRTTNNQSIPITVKDYYFQNGEMSLNGELKGVKNSVFILRANQRQVYGYAVEEGAKFGFEYTTNTKGQVLVEKVPAHKLISVCDFEKPKPSQINLQLKDDHIGTYPGTDVRKLQSLPGATKVMYMDIRDVMNGETPRYASKEDIWKVFQCLASALSAYNVNVTTDHAVYTATAVVNSGIAKFSSQTGRSYAPLNSFGTTRPSMIFRETNPKFYGLTLAHEVGHQLGLSHDRGNPGGEYFQGIPEFEWVPIMGNYYYSSSWANPLYQYSKGEYSSATNKEDDLNLIKRYLSPRADDNTQGKSLKITNGTINSQDNRGVIETNTDKDIFTFSVGSQGGNAKLTIQPIEYITFLDINAKIENSSGTVVASSNPKKDRKATFNVNLPQGTYKLIIESGAEGTPQNGFTKYSSMGWYGISGSISGTTNGEAPIVTFNNPKNNQTFTFDTLQNIPINVSVTDPNNSSYTTTINVDGKTFTGTTANWIPSSYGNFTITATATNMSGNKGSNSVNVVIKQATNTPPNLVISEPANGQVFEQSVFAPISIKVNATDPDGDLVNTKIIVDGTTYTSNSIQWTPSSYTSYTIKAIATDSKNASTEKTIQITIKKPTTGGNCSNVEAWAATKYYQIGDRVVYQNILYEAIWWNTGYAYPNIYSQVWKKISSCSSNTISTRILNNPVGNTLALQQKQGRVMVLDQFGNFIDEIISPTQDVSHYKAGVYVLKIINNNQVKTIKFIKK